MPMPLNTHSITVTLCQSVFILNALIKVLIWNLNKSPDRYRKYLNKLLKVCYVSTTSTVLIALVSSFFAVAINSTNEANKAAGTCR